MEEADYEKASDLLYELEDGLNMEEPVNSQLIIKERAALDYMRGLIGKEEQMRRLTQAAAQTMPEDVNLERWPLTQSETALWNNIASRWENFGEQETGIGILEKIKKNYERNQVELPDNATGYLLTLYNLTRLQGRKGEHGKALELCETGIRYCLLSGKGILLSDFLYAKAWNIHELEQRESAVWESKKKACFSLLKQAYSIAYAMRYYHKMQHIEKHCRQCYGISASELLDGLSLN